MSSKFIFVSYSSHDSEFVNRLIHDLSQAGLNVWRDSDGIKPGTPNWERTIRDTIRNSNAVLLVASPNAVASDYVHGELEIARTNNVPIYPVWADGIEWVECVPLNMSKYQHAGDCRAQKYAEGIKAVISTFGKVLSSAEGLVRLGLPTHEIIEISLAQFQSGFALANHIYLNHLQTWYDTFSYGSEWILANVTTKQLAIPWFWAEYLGDISSIYNLNWGELTKADDERFSLSEIGVQPDSYWAVWDARRLRSTVLIIKSDDLRSKILAGEGNAEIPLLIREKRLEERASSEIDLAQYQYKFVVADLSPREKRVLFLAER